MNLAGKSVTNILLNENNNETTFNDIAIPTDHCIAKPSSEKLLLVADGNQLLQRPTTVQSAESEGLSPKQ